MSEIRILLVDDEAQVRDVLGHVLRAAGYTVLEAGNYYEGMRAAKDTTIDLLIADVSLPGPNGCELAARILETQPDMQVLFISGYTGAEACRAYGILSSDAHFLGKPFTASDLLRKVHSVLHGPQPAP